MINTFKAKATPQALVDDALSSFTKAEVKLQAAMDEIERQEQALIAQQDAIAVKVGEAGAAKSRLSRIKQRITDILA
ncbi:hypothetical protein D3C85_1141150 [compost metagenome]